MKEFLKKNFAIVLAFLLPVAFIVIIALTTYLPSLFLSTDYNFIYAACTDGTGSYTYRCNNYLQKRFSVVNDELVVNYVEPNIDSNNNGIADSNEYHTARLFLHDTEKNESREITIAEAQALDLSGLLTSPDGLTVSSHYDRGGDFFLFFGGNSSHGYYLTKGSSKKRLNLINHEDRYYSRNNFKFLGWVLPDRE